MTATPQPESKSSSRRALLTGAMGGLAALAAVAIGRPPVAQGHDADDVLLGGSNLANSTTTIETPPGVLALSGFAHGSGVGLYGQSDSFRGVWGNCGSGCYRNLHQRVRRVTSRAQKGGGDDGNRTRVRGFADRSLTTRARRLRPLRWLPREDSNLGSRIQSPLSYH
jgi:hypothetical protein